MKLTQEQWNKADAAIAKLSRTGPDGKATYRSWCRALAMPELNPTQRDAKEAEYYRIATEAGVL